MGDAEKVCAFKMRHNAAHCGAMFAGGLSAGEGWLGDVVRWDGSAWQRVGNCIELPRDKCAFAQLGARLWIFGGFGPENAASHVRAPTADDDEEEEEEDEVRFRWFDELWSVDVTSGEWKREDPSGPRPEGRAGATLAALTDGTAVLFGGRTGQGRTNDAFLLRVTGDGVSWERLDQVEGAVPVARSMHAMTGVGNGRAVLVGGIGVADVSLTDAHLFSLTERAWVPLPHVDLKPILADDEPVTPSLHWSSDDTLIVAISTNTNNCILAELVGSKMLVTSSISITKDQNAAFTPPTDGIPPAKRVKES